MKSLAILALVLTASQGSAVGETYKIPRWEAGPFLSATTFGRSVTTRNLRLGYGGRITVNMHPNVGVEFQMAHFPGTITDWPGDPASQGSGQIKLTYRWEQRRRVNVFAVIGPGFLLEKDSYTNATGTHVFHYNSVAIAYGGGFEIVPHRRFAIRCDIADFVARYSYYQPVWYHHFDLKTALMFRF